MSRTRKVLFAYDGPVAISPDGRALGISFTRDMFKRYKSLGEHVTLLMRSKEVSKELAEHYSELTDDGVVFEAVPDAKGPVKMLTQAHALREKIRHHVSNSDIVVARLPSLVGSWALKEAWKQKKPVIVECVGCVWDSLWNHNALGKISAPYFFIKNKLLLSKASHVVYVTNNFLQSRYPSAGKWTHCSNVVIEPAPEDVVERKLISLGGIYNRTINITTVAGVSVPYKGQATVIRALAELGEERRHFKYKVVGGGDPSRLIFEAKRYGVEDLVEFSGPVPRDKIPEILDETDLYIQPSRQEGLPRALIEAMSRGCPAFGSTAGGIPELLQSSHIFRKGDYVALAKLLEAATQESLEDQVRRNWQVSHQYSTSLLEQRRQEFFKEFLSDFGIS